MTPNTERPENVRSIYAPEGIHYFRIVERGDREGVPYIVVERWMDPDTRIGQMEPFDGYYCGYVKTAATVASPNKGNTYDVGDAHVEITYGPDDGWWVGFDCAHIGLETMDDETVTAMTKGLADAVMEPRTRGADR